MKVVKSVNLLTNCEHYTKCHDYVDACEKMRRMLAEMAEAWVEGEDYTVEIVDVDDDFDFEDQPDWN